MAASALAGLLQTVRGWHSLNPDGVSYLDLGAKLLQSKLTDGYSGYWSPLYAILAAAAVPVAVVANAGRVMTTAILGEIDPRLAEGFYHGLEGWAVFVVAMVLLVGVERVLRRLAR